MSGAVFAFSAERFLDAVKKSVEFLYLKQRLLRSPGIIPASLAMIDVFLSFLDLNSPVGYLTGGTYLYNYKSLLANEIRRRKNPLYLSGFN